MKIDVFLFIFILFEESADKDKVVKNKRNGFFYRKNEGTMKKHNAKTGEECKAKSFLKRKNFFEFGCHYACFICADDRVDFVCGQCSI